MANVSIEMMFPVHLYKTKLETITETQIDYIKNITFEKILNPDALPLGSSSVTSYVLEDPMLLNIKSEIQQHLNFYMQNVLCPADHHNLKFKIMNSWVNKVIPNASIVPHLHRNSIVSGVFYINDISSPISFMKPNYNRNIEYMFDFKKESCFNKEHYICTPEKFSLLLFPSDLEHFVHLNKSDESRYSVAFNTFYVGSVGHKDDQNYLEFK